MKELTIRQKIIELMEDKYYEPMLREEIANTFQIDRKGEKEFFKVLESLENEKLIIKNIDNKYYLGNDESVIIGTLDANERGFGFVIPHNRQGEDIFVPASELNGAMHGDTVVVNIISEATSKKRTEGSITRVLERKNRTIVGTFTDSKKFGFLIPDEAKIGYDVFIPKAKKNGARHNQKVVVEITKWPEEGNNPEGRVVEILGYMSEKGTDILSIIRQYDLPEKFPSDVIDYVDNINQEVTDEEIKTRLDLRNENILTIDGFDAKDLDDAISIKRFENGNFKLGVHIADVSHYVKEKTVLDREAFKRGNSVYLLDRVIPMLPEELSNGICSLNPGEDRLCLSVIMEIDKTGRVQDSVIEETVIRSKKRLVYDDVSDYLEDDCPKAGEKLDGVLEDLKNMEELARILTKKREARGSIDFDFPETRIVLDDKGRPVKIVEEERRIANRIIEEFMLITNETVAEQFFWADIPFLYRTHGEPKEEKIEAFIKTVHNLGYSIKGKQEIHPKALQELLENIKGKSEEKLISTMMLRSLQKAVYSELPDIHFGLASEHYSHFTAPIRRYPDLVIHRIIKKYIKGKLSNSKLKKLERSLPEIAEHTSMTERRAEEAEREVDDMKKAEFMLDYIGYEFKGVISSLTRFGIFVQLENTIEGLVRFNSMKDDYYDFDEENYVVVGERTKNQYRLGQEVFIRVIDVSVPKRAIDFILIEDLEV